MRFSRSFCLMGLSVLALSACSSNNTGNVGTMDDIVIENRGIGATVKTDKKAVTTLEANADAKIVEVTETAKETVTEKTQTRSYKKEVISPISAQDDDTISDAEKRVSPMKRTQMLSENKAEAVATKSSTPTPAGNSDLPPNAKPGECYAKVLIPAKTRATSERLQISEEQKVLARIIPAQYKIETEKVLVKEARTFWKPGTGPHQRVDETTGQIMCLVEEPAEYKTIEKRVLVSPEKPEYKVMPAQFETVTRTETIEDERLEWRRILCETNVTPAVIMQIQRALNEKGYDAGPVDGRIGQKTLRAMNQFQVRNNLASRGMTYETIDSLGVKLAGM